MSFVDAQEQYCNKSAQSSPYKALSVNPSHLLNLALLF